MKTRFSSYCCSASKKDRLGLQVDGEKEYEVNKVKTARIK